MCRYAECRYAECRYAECRGTLFTHLMSPFIFLSRNNVLKSLRRRLSKFSGRIRCLVRIDRERIKLIVQTLLVEVVRIRSNKIERLPLVSLSNCVIEHTGLLGRFVSYEENGVL